MEKLRRDFLWSGLGEESKIHLVKWTKICGGLAIRTLKRFNQAFLSGSRD